MCPFDFTAVASIWKVVPVNQIIYTVLMAGVILTDHPKLVRKRCVRNRTFQCRICFVAFKIFCSAFAMELCQISSIFPKTFGM